MRISDWSSDVCSSDLEEGRRSLEEGLRAAGVSVERVAAYRSRPAGSAPEGWAEVVAHPPRCVLFGSPRTVERSEERRVGTECDSKCRHRWWPDHSKNNEMKSSDNLTHAIP